MVDINVACRIYTPTLAAIELETAPYSLEAATRAEQAVSMRKHTVASPYVEGEFTTHAVAENVVERLNVFVEADTAMALNTAVKALTDRLKRTTFTVEWDWLGSMRETWTCFAANHTIETSQPLIVARTALVRAEVPRLPTVTIGAL